MSKSKKAEVVKLFAPAKPIAVPGRRVVKFGPEHLQAPPPGIIRAAGPFGEYLESDDNGETWAEVDMSERTVFLGLDWLINSGPVPKI